MSFEKRKRKPPTSRLERMLVIGIIALAVATILPSVRLTREAVAVERAARCLEKSEAAITFILKNDPTVTNRSAISLDMIDKAFADTNLSAHTSPPAWPEEAVRDSFNPGKNGDPTISVQLKAGGKTVSIDDIAIPPILRKQQ